MKKSVVILCSVLVLQTPKLFAAGSPTIGLQAGLLDFIGKAPSVGYGYIGEAQVTLPVSKKLSLGLVSGFGQQKFSHPLGNFTTQLLSLDLCGIYHVPLAKWLQPYALVGTGVINFKRGNWPNFWDASAIAGGGVDILAGANVAFRVAADYRYTTGKDFDGISSGENDSYVTAKAGLHFSFTPGEEKKSQEESLASSELFDLLIEDVKAPKEKDDDPEIDEGNTSLVTQESPQSDEWISRDNSKQITDYILAAQEDNPQPEATALQKPSEPSENTGDKEVEERQKLIEKLKKELEEKNRRLAQLKQRKAEAANTPPLSTISNFKQEYEKGLELFNQQSFDEAKIVFQSLLRADPTHRLASNCQYWLGECAFAQGEFGAAIEAFEKTLEFQGSPKTDDALIMLGITYRRLGQNQKATEYFVRLLTEFEDSEYVSVASKFVSDNRLSYSEF